MQNQKRLAAAADFRNHPSGFLVLDVVDFDGGDFELHPKTDETSLYLPSTDAPGYRVAITGQPDVIDRLGRALQALARRQKGTPDPDDGE